MRINEKIPDIEADAYCDGEIKRIRLSDYRGKWLVLLFYPADFTFVCPTELKEMADNYEEFRKLGAEVLSVSTDTAYAHKAWHDESPAIRAVQFPMAADPTGRICTAFGTYVEDEGLSVRGSFIIDPDGVVKALEMHDNAIGRNAEELLRKLQAAIYVRGHEGEVCPASWRPGAKTLKPSIELVGKI